MYYPYLRGKQNELLLLKENASSLLKDSDVIPIIEPVKKNLSALNRTLESLKESNIPFIFIINPKHGDLKEDISTLYEEIINETLKDYSNFYIGYIVDTKSNIDDIKKFLDSCKQSITLIHNGYTNAKELGNLVKEYESIKKHIFLDDQILYRRQFKKGEKILIRDGFKKTKNSEYPPEELFSELHLVYDEMGLDGFGDFLIVGDEYSETGGPAYAIAIHLTYFNDDEILYIKHFISDRVNTPTDPAGKFAEALRKLVDEVESNNSIYKSEAYKQYKKFNEDGHFPGLGYVKKLSMQHHIEIIVKFLKEQ